MPKGEKQIFSLTVLLPFFVCLYLRKCCVSSVGAYYIVIGGFYITKPLQLTCFFALVFSRIWLLLEITNI